MHDSDRRGEGGRGALLSLLGAAVLLFVGGWAAEQTLDEYGREPDTYGAQQVYEDKPVTSLAGEFRGTLAGFLYARADEYMHGGVRMRTATEREVDGGARLASHADTMRDTHGKGETSVIPEAERDARGVWGQIERDTQPFMDVRHHKHKDISEALPLFRLMTWSDPHFVEAYNFGAFLVFSAAQNHNLNRALNFLEEGIENNPNSYVLHTEYGQYQLNDAKNLLAARDHFLKAAQIVQRTPAAQIEKVDAQDQQEAERGWEYLVITYRKLKDTANERQWAQNGLKRYPDSPTFHRSLKRLEVIGTEQPSHVGE